MAARQPNMGFPDAMLIMDKKPKNKNLPLLRLRRRTTYAAPQARAYGKNARSTMLARNGKERDPEESDAALSRRKRKTRKKQCTMFRQA